MKQLLTFLLLLCSYILGGAQATTLSIDNQTPGWLSSKINYGDQQTVESLTITGYINASDLKFIGSLMQKQKLHQSLNLSEVGIVGEASNDDNEISYDNIFGLTAAVNVNLLSLPKSIRTPTPKSNIKPFRYLSVDTLVYGSETCQEYNNALWGYIYSGGSGAGSSPKHLILRDGVTTIEAYACDNYQYNSYGNNVKIETVSCPVSMKFIGTGAFRECNSLRFINLPDNITEIQKLAFEKSSYTPDTLKLPESLNVYYTNSFPIKNGQVIELGSNISKFDNESWVLKKDMAVTYVINREVPPIFRKGARYSSYQDSYSDGKELLGCTLYVPKGGYSMYTDPKYNSVGAGGTWSGWTNPYSHANIKTIHIPVEEITLNHSSTSLNVGNSIDLVASVLPTDADNQSILWSSSNHKVASVSPDGVVTAISCGNAVISAYSSENPNIYATCEVIVHQPLQTITLNAKNITLTAGQTYDGLSLTYYPATADNKDVTWQSSNTDVVTVDSEGKITAIKGGESKITVCSVENSNIKDECMVTVLQPTTGISLDKTDVEITEDESIQLIATVLPENASNKKVNWMSSDVSVAMVSPNGTVYAIKSGQANVMATTVDGGFAALCKVTVKAKTIQISDIRLSTNSGTIAVGETLQLNAIIAPDNASNKTIIWSSTNPTIASVNASGLVTAISEGNTKIIASATDDSGVSAECTVIVSESGGIDYIIADKSIYVKIFNLKGVLVYEGVYSEASLLPDYYVIVCDGKNIKVKVK